jgi:uncharacterized NAD-dependent epimerase/dehydratase family protein
MASIAVIPLSECCKAMLSIKTPYLLLIGDMENPVNAKTAFGLRDWAPQSCVGQLRFSDRAVDLGIAHLTPREAVAAGAKTLVVGIAPVGGQLPLTWHATLKEALEAGLDLAAGLHQRLRDLSEIAALAKKLGREIHDVRHSSGQDVVASGLRRTGRRLLTVGTDCALGKKYTALALTRAMKERGHAADFRATGQTGILISGSGIAIDAVVADFIAGTAETLSPANDPAHWDIIEGQGSLFHPAYAGVTLGLLHGSQPDALVLCHDPTRKTLNGFPHVPVPTPAEALPAYLSAARLTNPTARFIGVALNTVSLDAKAAAKVIADTSQALGIACVDPIRTGVEPLMNALEAFGAP